MSQPLVYLDPANQALANQTATQPPLEDLTVQQLRDFIEKLQKHDPIPGVTRTSFTVPFEEGVKTYIFKSKGSTGYLPVIFFFHGGAWIGGRSVIINFVS